MSATETQTHTQDNYYNPRCAYTVRVNASLANLCYKITPEDHKKVNGKNYRRQDRDGLYTSFHMHIQT